MKNLKKHIPILLILLSVSFVRNTLSAQIEETKSHPKHEIGFSFGAFPIIGFIDPTNDGFAALDDNIGHTYYMKRDDNYEKMYHLGSYTFNYNYHFNQKNSLGASLSWVGKHIDRHWITSDYMIIGSGWKHYFTLQGNYRRTYYHKNNISLYFGIHCGITLCVKDKDILYKEPIESFLGTENNIKVYVFPALQLSGIGMEIGKKNVFNIELGVGTQGLLKMGFRHKF